MSDPMSGTHLIDSHSPKRIAENVPYEVRRWPGGYQLSKNNCLDIEQPSCQSRGGNAKLHISHCQLRIFYTENDNPVS